MIRRSATPIALAVLCVLLAWAAVATWYDNGAFVAAGDIAPFLRAGLKADAGNTWGYSLTGAGSAIAESSRLFDLVALQISNLTGGSPADGQKLFYIMVLALAAGGTLSFARSMVNSTFAAVAVAVLAIANPLMAVNLPNPLVPIMVGSLGLVAGALIRAAKGEGSVPMTVVSTLPVSYLGVNPPSLAVVAVATIGLVVLAGCVGPAGSWKRLARHLAVAGPLAFIGQLWWLAPTFYLFGLGGAPEVAAETNVEAWAWSQANNSLPNVISLTAHWAWGQAEYLPFSTVLDRWPNNVARFALPLLALLGPIAAKDRRKRWVAISALALTIPTIIVAKGLHEPFIELNRWLFTSVPGMWLLREPMSKVGPVLLLLYLVPAAITIDGVTAVNPLRSKELGQTTSALTVLGLVLLALSFGRAPLIGAVAPGERASLPSSRVVVPASWYSAADDINSDPTPGKVLVLPTLPFYQATTTWGFHGVASLPRDLVTRPTLLNLPGGYFSDTNVVADLAAVVEEGRADTTKRALEALGVSHVLVRLDLTSDQLARPLPDGEELLTRLESTGLFEPAEVWGEEVAVLRFAGSEPVQVSTQLASTASVDLLAYAVASAPSGALVSSETHPDLEAGHPGAMTVIATQEDPSDEPLAIEAAIDGDYVIEQKLIGTAPVSVKTTDTSLALVPEFGLLLDGEEVATAEPLRFGGMEHRPIALMVDDFLVHLEGAKQSFDLPLDAELRVVSPASPAVELTDWTEVRNCRQGDDTTTTIDGRLNGDSVDLWATGDAACTSVALPEGIVRLAFRYRSDHGRICVYLPGSGCLVEEVLAPVETWESYSVVAILPEGAQLFVYADFPVDGGGPEAERRVQARYRDLRMRPLKADLVPSPEVLTLRTELSLSEGSHEVTAIAPVREIELGEPSEVMNCNHNEDDPDLEAVWNSEELTLLAGADSACVTMLVGHTDASGRQLTGGGGYNVSFEHATTSGQPARWCLWMEREQSCANRETVLDSSRNWKLHRETVQMGADTKTATLFLYADASGNPEGVRTETKYRKLSMSTSTTTTMTVRGPSDEARPELTILSASPEHYEVELAASSTPTILALADSAHADWAIEGPTASTATPIVVDGFRQGWILPAQPTATLLTIQFVPARWLGLTRAASITVWVAVAASALWSVFGRRRAGRRRPATVKFEGPRSGQAR